MITTFMGLDLPTPTVTLGPEWATDLNAALEIVDGHDHTSGRGKRITPAAMNINATLSFNANAATNISYLNLETQASSLVGASLIYNLNGNLYYNNGSGVPVQITDGGTVVTTPATTQVLEYNEVATDTVIGAGDTAVIYSVDTTAARNITLPLASSVSAGRIYIIKDRSGLSETNTLTVTASGADTIDGAASQPLQSNFGTWFVVGNGSSAYYII